MKIIKLLTILLYIIILVTNLYSQSGNVVVRIKKPPPYQFFTEDMFKITIINTGTETYRIFLRGRSTELIEGLLVEASCNTFTVPPGVKNITTADIGKVTIDKKNEKYKDVITRMGQLPSGSYDICVEAVNAADNTVLSEDCISHEVLQVSQLMLVYPGNESVIGDPGSESGEPFNSPPIRITIKRPPITFNSDNNEAGAESLLLDSAVRIHIKKPPPPKININRASSQIQFTWLPPVPVPVGYSVTYKLKIAEVIGMQSAYDAMQSNPLFYSQGSIVTTSYQYPLAARPFNTGKKYAWQVLAYVNGTLLSESEIWEFRFGISQPFFTPTIRIPIKTPPKGLLQDENSVLISSGSTEKSKTNPVYFSFSSIMYGESSNRSGTGSDKKPQNGYLELTPSIGVYGIPFSTSILFSSENSGSRQSVNSAGMNLDINYIKEYLSERFEKEKEKLITGNNIDVSKLSEKELQKIESEAGNKVRSKLSPLAKIVTDFRSLGIGTTYPSYTPLTVHGVPLTGLNFEYNPGWFYVALAGAKNIKAIENTSFTRLLYSGRIGYGQKEKSHFYLTGMYANDKASTITVDSSNQLLKPNSNYLFGIEGKLNLFKEKLVVEAEAVGSMLTRDNRDANLENNSIPNFVKNMFHPKLSSQVDYSYTVKTSYNNERSNTRLTAGVKMIGPGFVTLGNPTLRGDKLEVEARAEQKLVNSQVTIKGSLKWFWDNLIKSRSATTTNVIPSFMVNLNFKKMPYFMISYMPVFMNNNAVSGNLKFNYKSHMVMFNSGHFITVGKSYLNTNLSYTFNKATSSDTASGYTSQGLTLYESLTLDIPLSFSAGFSAQFFDYTNDYSRILSFDGSITYTLEDIITNTLGIANSVDNGKNSKLYLYLGTGINLVKGLSLDLRAEKNLYKDWQNNFNNYDEFMLKGTITTSF